MPASRKSRRRVHVQRGQVVEVQAGGGCLVEVERFGSGAVEVRNALTGHVLRSWAPKDARRAS